MLRSGILLLLVWLSGCDKATTAKSTTSLLLQLQYSGQPLNCDSSLMLADTPWQLAQFQLYLSEFRLNNKPLLLDPTPVHQQQQLALLGSVCGEPENANWQLKFTRPLTPGELTFVIAVPLSRNHQDPLTAKPPLNQSDMFWSWQQGYKYLRLDMHSTAQPGQQWSLHLGAAGCQSASPMRAPAVDCSHTNRATVSLAYQPGQQLVLDLAPLLAGVKLSADNHCMSDPNRLSCQTLLPRLGIGTRAQGWSMQ